MDKTQLDIERILELMEVKSISKKKKLKRSPQEEEIEMKEEGEAAASGSGPSAGYPTVTKWETGLTRGPGNPIGNAKRQDKTTRGKGNTLI